jgi:hypothetical protein
MRRRNQERQRELERTADIRDTGAESCWRASVAAQGRAAAGAKA